MEDDGAEQRLVIATSRRWFGFAGTGPQAQRWWEFLLAGYCERHRRYHGLAHVERVTRDVDGLLAGFARNFGISATEMTQFAGGRARHDGLLRAPEEWSGIDGDAVRLAAWLHDVVYEPTAGSGTNEAASAVLAQQCAVSFGWVEARAARVSALVLATAGHEADAPDAAVLLDADLAVLGAEVTVYNAYVAAVRAEYAHVSEEQWRVGRAKVLRSFLERPQIYALEASAEREIAARRNLAAELANLGEPAEEGA